jgi:hypothetical protein
MDAHQGGPAHTDTAAEKPADASPPNGTDAKDDAGTPVEDGPHDFHIEGE